EEIRRQNRKVLGPIHCLRISPFQRAKAYAVFGARDPTFAVLGGGKALYTVAVTQLRAFRASYRTAPEQWRKRKRHVCFPRGTWLMRVQHGVLCGGAVEAL